MLWMPIEVRTEGKGEKYVVSIPAYACKEDLKQVVEDGMLIRNRNFVQLAELVCLQLLCTALISLSNYSFILMRYFLGSHGYPEHNLPAPRVSDTKGCIELRLYAQYVVSDHRVLSASLAEVESSSRCWENEGRGSVERMARAEVKRDAARHDAFMARMDANAARSAQAKVESKLAMVQNAFAVAEKVGGKQMTRLAV